MLPPAPPLFSTNTEPPRTCCISAAIMRAEMSEGPPGVLATTILSGRSGWGGSPDPTRRRVGAGRPAAIAPVALRTRRRDILIAPFDCVIGILPQGCFDWGHARN